MFKPFTNTKTCVLFLQKREQELTNISEANSDAPIVFAVSERPGKDRSGDFVTDLGGNVVSDLPEIADFVEANATWGVEDDSAEQTADDTQEELTHGPA